MLDMKPFRLMPAKSATAGSSSHSIGTLTAAVLGQELSIAAAWDHVESIPYEPSETLDSETTWIGSVGYERHKSVDDFARLLAAAGVERLVDVRELPISRRKGFAKSALAAALAEQSVEYLHIRSMGNPKEFRDLYKSGKVAEGKAGFEELLARERGEDLRELAEYVQEKRSALMCVEHDESTCHRQVIFAALQKELGLDLEVARIG